MNYLFSLCLGVLLSTLVGLTAIPSVVSADDHDDQERTKLCFGVPPGHLIAPGFKKKQEPDEPDTRAPIITKIRVDDITEQSAILYWKTDEKTTGFLSYGLSTSYGFTSATDGKFRNEHKQKLVDLQSNTTYHVRVEAKDRAGNTSVSSDVSFTTRADEKAPALHDVSISAMTATSVVIQWKTREPADAQVVYGTTAAYESSTPFNAAFVTAHQETVSGLHERTTYHFQVRSHDAAGNLAVSQDMTFTTPDATPPAITHVTVTQTTFSSFTIRWETDEPADGQVVYGLTASYGLATGLDRRLVRVHEHTLSSLALNTVYHYQVRSRDASGNVGVSGDVTFTTSTDTTPPVLSTITVSNLGMTAATITWTTNEDATSTVYYGGASPFSIATAASVSTSMMLKTHAVVLTNLSSNTTYTFVAESKDALGNMSRSSEQSFKTLP